MWRLPAEWEPHEATILTWPHDTSIWGPLHAAAEAAFAEVVARLSEGEQVVVLIPDGATEARARALWQARGARRDRVAVVPIESDDIWVRDHGPLCLLGPGGARRLVDYRFDAWGKQFPYCLLYTSPSPRD